METEVLVKDLIELWDNFINFLIKNPAFVPSSIIAIITCLGYNKIVANKVNEKQLEQVLDLIDFINKIKIELYFQQECDKEVIIEEKSLVEIVNEKNSKEYETSLFLYIKPNEDQKNLAFRKGSVITLSSEQYNERKNKLDKEAIDSISLEKLSKYQYNFLIPNSIKNILKFFSISEITTKEYGLKSRKKGSIFLFDQGEYNNQKKTYFDPDTGNKLLKLPNPEELCINYKYPFIIVSDKEHEIVTSNLNVVDLTEDQNSAYYNWGYFQRNCNKLITEINRWLKKNNVKGVKL